MARRTGLEKVYREKEKMKMRKNRAAILIFMLTCCLTLPLACDSNITGSEQNGSGETGYYLYAGTQGLSRKYGDNRIYIVDTNSNTTVDSIGGFLQDIHSLKVSPDGKRLYVTTRKFGEKGKLYIIDVESRTRLLLLDDVDADVYVAPDGKAFVIAYAPDSPHAYLGWIDRRSDEIAFFDTLAIRQGRSSGQSIAFDTSRTLLYGVNNQEKLFAYQYREKRLVRTYDNILVHKSMVISPDGNYIYIAGGPVVDLEEGQIIARVGYFFFGSLALSPDGALLYITDPGRYIHQIIFPTGKFYVYDTRSYRFVDEIDVSQNPSEKPITDQIVLTRDGNIAYVSDWGKTVFAIDLQTRELVDTIRFAFRIVPIALSVKP